MGSGDKGSKDLGYSSAFIWLVQDPECDHFYNKNKWKASEENSIAQEV